MEKFSPNGFSLNGKALKAEKLENIEKLLKKLPKDYIIGNLNIGNIEEIPTGSEIKICFSFKGGWHQTLKDINNIYQKIKSNNKISEILRENFGIELDGDRKCFVVGFRIDKNLPNFETLKEEARQILEEIKEKLNPTNN